MPTLTLEQHAGLTAALAEGHPPADVLALEGLDDPSWRAADAAWKEKLATEGPEAPLFVTYRDALAVAEDWLSRAVDPLDGDIAAWMGFLGAYGAHAAPFELLQKLGLGLNDLSRLGRRWAKKLAEDEQVQKQAAEIAKKKPRDVPSVRAKEGKLRPFPWSKGAPKIADEKAKIAHDNGPPVDDDFGLDQYASVSAELALDPKAAEHVLTKYGISREDLEGIEARWKARIEADPALERDWRRLYASYHARFGAASKRAEAIDREAAAPVTTGETPPAPREPIDAPPPKPIFASTSLSLAIPRSALLPFIAGLAPPEIAEPTPAEEKEERPRNNLGGTALALDVPRGPALPFEGLGAPLPPPNPKLLAGTSLALDVPRGPALPFTEGEAPESISQPSAAEEQGNRARRAFGGTSLALDVPATPVLPFEDDTEAQAARRKANPLAQMSLDIDIQALLRKAAIAPPPEAPPKPSPVQATSILPVAEAPAPPPAPSPLQATSILPASLLPVAEAPGPLPAPPPPRAPSPLQATSILPDSLVSTLPRPVPEAPPAPEPPWAPELSLEQHASLCVEIAMTPDHAADVIARYRLTTEQKARIDEHYRARVAESPEVRATWDRAYRAYYEWMAKAR